MEANAVPGAVVLVRDGDEARPQAFPPGEGFFFASTTTPPCRG